MSSPKKLGDLLLARRLISPTQLERALEIQRHSPQSLASIVVANKFVSEELLLKALAAHQHVTAWSLEKDRPQVQALRRLPSSICRQYQILPVEVRGDLLLVAMRNPGDLEAIELARNVSGMRVEPVLANDERLAETIEQLIESGWDASEIDGHVKRAMSEISGSELRQPEHHDLTDANAAPVIGLVNQLLTDAIRMRASDIHVEPSRQKIELRYRLDGQLVTVRDVPGELLSPLVTRLKIMAELDIVEYRLPQDGRITVVVDGRSVDLRMSVLPTVYGQRVVLRVLDKGIALRSLDDLHFGDQNLAIFKNLIKRPHGLFLVTGPTGSGKTTTLYAALMEVRNGTNNIMTCEDPVEYDVPGIAQSQVNEKVGLTFAAQLRAILRQDPDVVLVGEIRDRETADTAIRASLTGHMVFSTLHCNDALSAVPRLLDMGVEPFLLSTSMVGVTAQRLVRKLCGHCRQEAELDAADRQLFESMLGSMPTGSVFEPVGCERCHRTGYRGRLAVHEIVPVVSDLASLVAAKAPMAELKRVAAMGQGSTLQTDALRRVLAGETSLSEVRRVVPFDELASSVSTQTFLRAA